MQTKAILAVGARPFGCELGAVASQLGLELLEAERFNRGVEELLLTDQPLCAVCDPATAAGRELCAQVRSSAALLELQVFAIVREPWGNAVSQAFSVGADDIVLADHLPQLGEKVAALANEQAAVGAAPTGRIVCAHPDRAGRINVGRHLRRTGLEVYFAVEAPLLFDSQVRLVVAHASLPPQGVAWAVRATRAKLGAEVPWVVIGSEAELLEASAELDGELDLVFVDTERDASPVIFVANGLIHREVQPMRRTARHPYATPVRWETEGEGLSRWGYSYNINQGGLYVRTYTPPPVGTSVTLELSPPFGRGRVLVDGVVAWRQGFNRHRGNPPGFGVKYAETNAPADAAALDAGYAELSNRRGGWNLVSPAPDLRDDAHHVALQSARGTR